jgi:hypothetical protein
MQRAQKNCGRAEQSKFSACLKNKMLQANSQWISQMKNVAMKRQVLAHHIINLSKEFLFNKKNHKTSQMGRLQDYI